MATVTLLKPPVESFAGGELPDEFTQKSHYMLQVGPCLRRMAVVSEHRTALRIYREAERLWSSLPQTLQYLHRFHSIYRTRTEAFDEENDEAHACFQVFRMLEALQKLAKLDEEETTKVVTAEAYFRSIASHHALVAEGKAAALPGVISLAQREKLLDDELSFIQLERERTHERLQQALSSEAPFVRGAVYDYNSSSARSLRRLTVGFRGKEAAALELMLFAPEELEELTLQLLLGLHGAGHQEGDYLVSFDEGNLTPGPLQNLPTFELLSGGCEMNVYLHRSSGLVFKVRHSASYYNTYEAAPEAVHTAHQEAYRALANAPELELVGAHYVTSHFLEMHGIVNRPIAVVVQPFLSPERYRPYRMTDDETGILKDAGFSDLHCGNVLLDQITGEALLLDCLYISDELVKKYGA
jgi:hypothetical protein